MDEKLQKTLQLKLDQYHKMNDQILKMVNDQNFNDELKKLQIELKKITPICDLYLKYQKIKQEIAEKQFVN
ncbi:hypothetical protein [Mycoplasma sp. SG1]|uniref:hypothetical protein n=1 Tax=Mycoplasma sp. SG1 TaxID=2810348 RepID=UPI0020246ED0|nr:hypothetical protein [Mycoplasma sp. SG1]URM52957.1 hypothetical protein JRW51_01260 [Mycoplasma sp. SG1]